MRSSNPVLATVIACAVLALSAAAIGLALGYPKIGLALGVGLLIGSGNGYFARAALASSISFRATSTARLAVLTALGLAAGLLIGLDVFWWSLLGIAGAQLVLASAAAYSLARP
ncbi:MAG TPA: hypothetical protein VNG93_12720 [Candidatus Dormibacteraeota bacterium]|nr:hypothetical protein [Candidatus Dormibacteraeota bacterium]